MNETTEILGVKSQNGCGSNSGVARKPKGMATNGPCLCIPRVDINLKQKIINELARMKNEHRY